MRPNARWTARRTSSWTSAARTRARPDGRHAAEAAAARAGLGGAPPPTHLTTLATPNLQEIKEGATDNSASTVHKLYTAAHSCTQLLSSLKFTSLPHRCSACPTGSGRRSAPTSAHSWPTVWARPGRLSGLSVSHSKSVFYGAFVRARRARNSQKWRFPARAVEDWERPRAQERTIFETLGQIAATAGSAGGGGRSADWRRTRRRASKPEARGAGRGGGEQGRSLAIFRKFEREAAVESAVAEPKGRRRSPLADFYDARKASEPVPAASGPSRRQW